MGGRGAAAAADDLRSLPAPLERELGVLARPDALVEAPALAGLVAEVRVDAKREIGEIPEPRQHAPDVVCGEAVDEQSLHAELLEALGGPAEHVAFRTSPVLPVDAAHPVTAPAEAEPDGKPARQRDLDAREREPLPDQRHGLEQQQVRGVVLEHPGEQLERHELPARVEVAVQAERDRALGSPARLLDSLAREPDPRASRRRRAPALRESPTCRSR